MVAGLTASSIDSHCHIFNSNLKAIVTYPKLGRFVHSILTVSVPDPFLACLWCTICRKKGLAMQDYEYYNNPPPTQLKVGNQYYIILIAHSNILRDHFISACGGILGSKLLVA